MSKEKTVWNTLNDIDVKPYIKKKGQLDYLPWSVAIGLVKPYYPNMKVKVYESDSGINYFSDGNTCFVKVGVTIEDLEEIEYLPIMDFKNKSIPKDNVTSVDVNKSIKRAVVKALSSHGLGIVLYAGEELPSIAEDKEEIFRHLEELINASKDIEATKQWICKTYNVLNIIDLNAESLKHVINLLKQKAQK